MDRYHPTIAYQLATERIAELEAAGDAHRQRKSLVNPCPGLLTRLITRLRTPAPAGTPQPASAALSALPLPTPDDLAQALHQTGRIVDVMDWDTRNGSARPVLRNLLSELLIAGARHGLTVHLTVPDDDADVVLTLRTLAVLSQRVHARIVALPEPAAERVGHLLAELKAIATGNQHDGPSHRAPSTEDPAPRTRPLESEYSNRVGLRRDDLLDAHRVREQTREPQAPQACC